MGTKAGVGRSLHKNPQVAGKEAVEQALAHAAIGKPDFVFLFATVGYNQQALVKAVREASGGARLSGCSGEGIIAGDMADESNFAVTVMVIQSDELRFENGLNTGLKEDSAQVGKAWAEALLPHIKADAIALFAFPDALSVNFAQLLSGLETRLNLDRLLPVLGGTAGDNWQYARTYQYCNDDVVSDGVAWTLVSGQGKLIWSVNHGCVPVGIELTVTRAKGNTIYELNGRPALSVLNELLPVEELKDWRTAVVNLGFGLKTAAELGDFGHFLLRAMVGGKDDTTGSVSIPTDISEGSKLWVMRRDFEKVTAGTQEMAARILSQMAGAHAKMGFHFDCAGRGKVFVRDHQKLELLHTLRSGIGEDIPWFGFYTFGEIGPVGGANCIHNYTAIVAIII